MTTIIISGNKMCLLLLKPRTKKSLSRSNHYK